MQLQQFPDRAVRHYSERLALRPIALSDAWPLFEATRTEGFNEHLLWQRPDSHLPVFERIESIMTQSRNAEVAALAAVQRNTGQFVALYRFAPFADAIEMSLWTHPAFWGGGYGTETTMLAMQAAMVETDAPRLYARSMHENTPAHKVLKKAGLQPTDIGSIVDESGRDRTYFVYCIERTHWRAPCERSGMQVLQQPAWNRASDAIVAATGAAKMDWTGQPGLDPADAPAWHPAAASSSRKPGPRLPAG